MRSFGMAMVAVVALAGCGAGALGGTDDLGASSDDVRHHGSSGSTGSCSSYAAPDQSANCPCASGHSCSANGCYGGYYCDLSRNKCVSPSSVPSCPGSTSTSTSTSSSGGTTSSSGGTSGSCGYAAPDQEAGCPCASGHTCTANGCYGGYYCDLSRNKCVSPSSVQSCPGSSSTSSSGTTGTTSSGTTGSSTTGTTSSSTTGGTTGWSGSVTAQGGTVSRLYFTAVGDSRPPNLDDTSQYPSSVIDQIYRDMATVNPEFVVATGDYMYATPSGSNGAQQMSLYMQARQAYPGVVFAAMGNHECNGYTAGNCTSTSQSNNYAAFMQSLIQPLGQSKPYYRFDVNASDGSWTAKFIVLAMNAWDSTQASWLTSQMQQQTTYTFIIRHEPESATTAPGVTPSDNIIKQYPYTLKIVGHTHEFSRPGTREVIVGNGGAPLTGSGTYGYAVIEQNANGDIQVSNMDVSSNSAVQTFVVPK